ncbi:diacylglycerol kinase [Vagococcus xieshaowenii]|uniref:Diacylglycerol kinase n=1 Tax=Vagococcus xieshaowenii TaxID=2562451 RepID=A0A4Z0DCJ7_9ENTE|nr:diacylglycerol kinase [Vagococcus xieshaowenii]QCA28194.1 diacylglycerol kinase [Vagococcus xieshaowenii]TFZ42547.1 diacylglycerol kinase [Vagococcus xieshaowenii]
MRARVIYNPTSGKELLKRHLPDILMILEEAGYEASAYATTPEPNSAETEARRAAIDGFDLVVAAGGDGTINQVINGIAPLEKRPRVGIIPGGTTNDYARALKIPRNDVLEAARVMLKKQTLKIDVGQADDHYFINIGAGGYLTELTYEVPSQLKSIFGYLAYIVKGAEMLPRVKPINMRLEYDDGVYEGEASMFFVGLTNSVGGFETIVPDAQLDDGKFSLIIVKTANLVEILRLIVKLLNGGKHVNDAGIIYTKTSELNVAPMDEDVRLMMNLDGEYGGDAPMRFKALPQHIEFYVNLDEMSEDSYAGDNEMKEVSDAFVKEMEVLTQEDLNEDGKIS